MPDIEITQAMRNTASLEKARHAWERCSTVLTDEHQNAMAALRNLVRDEADPILITAARRHVNEIRKAYVALLSIQGRYVPVEQDERFKDLNLVHKATPPNSMVDDECIVSECVLCDKPISKVCGGQGMTWVHTATGAVAAANLPVDA